MIVLSARVVLVEVEKPIESYTELMIVLPVTTAPVTVAGVLPVAAVADLQGWLPLEVGVTAGPDDHVARSRWRRVMSLPFTPNRPTPRPM